MPRRLTKADHRAFVGISSSGKSTLCRHQIASFYRAVIFDPNSEPENAEGATFVIHDRRELLATLQARGNIRVVWRGFERYGKAAFEIGNQACWAVGDLAVMWDEVDLFADARKSLPPTAYNMVHTGRHRGLRVFACARRASRIHIDIRSQCARIMAARTIEPADVKALEERMGAQAGGLVSLRDYEFLDWSERGCSVKKSPFK
jgi:hypothetical protein